MQKTIITLSERWFCGITSPDRTSNKAEADSRTAQIPSTMQQYFGQRLAENHPLEPADPGTTYCVYTEYDSDFTGGYRYFIGEEVVPLSTIPLLPDPFVIIRIPSQTYAKFTIGPGKMPDICIQSWQKIWKMSPTELGDERAYRADFERYDAGAQDLKNAVFDIYIGLKGQA